MKHKFLVVVLGLCSWLAAVPASAQLARVGETFSVWADTSRGSAVGYDTRNNVFLVVSAHGRVNGRFVSADGAVLGEPFVFQAVAGFGQFPQLAYSPDANGGNGAFMVTWHESDGPAPSVHTRMISYTAGFLTADRVTVGNDTYHEIMGAPIAYSTVSREFLIVWRQYFDVNVFGLRLNNNGDTIGTAIPVAATTLFESDQSLTYNPVTDEFLAVYRRGFGPTSVMAQRIKAGTGALVGGPSVVSQASTINTTGVTYNPTTGQYLVAWHQMPGDFIVARVVAADGTPLGNATAISTRVGTYDSLSVDANEISGSVLMVGHDKLSVEVGGAEINSAGNPLSNGGPITGSGGGGNHLPKVSSNPTRREWLVSAARNFAQTIAQRVSTATPGGGNPPPPPPPPPPTPVPVTNPRMSLDVPSVGAAVSGQFAVSGWAIDLGAMNAIAGSGVDTVHVWAQSATNGEWKFLGAANMGVSRPDVAAVFNSAQFSTSGFGMTATLPPGTYDVNVFAHSVVSGTFNNVQTKRITVVTPPSNPRMFIDLPTQEFATTRGTSFTIAGWAVDLSSPSGAGVEAIHVWAYPRSGAAPVFVGATTLTRARWDVAGVFGSQFAVSGYSLQGVLPEGDYNLVVFALSSVAHDFNNATGLHMRVF